MGVGSSGERFLACSHSGDLKGMRQLVEDREIEAVEAVALVTEDGKQPLHWAAYRGDHRMASYLVEIGADLTGQDTFLYTPLHHASEMGYMEVVECLVRCAKYGRSLPTEENVQLEGRPQRSGSAVERMDASDELKAVVNALARHSITPLHCAAKYGHVVVVKYLLENSADANAITAQSVGSKTPLHFAAQLEDWAIVKLLLSHGADPTLQDITGIMAVPVALARARGEHAIADCVVREPHIKRRVTFLLGMTTSQQSSERKQQQILDFHAPGQSTFSMKSFDEMARNQCPLRRSFYSNQDYDIDLVKQIFSFLEWPSIEQP